VRRNAYLIIENKGSGDARKAGLTWVIEAIEEGFHPPMTHDMEDPIASLAEGAHVEFSLLLHSGTADRANLRIQWEDELGQHEHVQTLVF
jgi:hypothetical protein